MGSPPGLKPLTSKLFRGNDLLPIDPKEVASYLLDDGQVIVDSVQGMVTVLSYLALCSGNAPVPEELPDRPLTKPQERVVDHLRKAVSYLEESGQVVRSFEESSVPLGVARCGYDREPIMVMEDIQADLVVAAWPEVGQAAVQEKLEDPRSCLLPLHEWPDPPPQSKVRASDEVACCCSLLEEAITDGQQAPPALHACGWLHGQPRLPCQGP